MYSHADLFTKVWLKNTELTEVLSKKNTTSNHLEMILERRKEARHNVNEGTYAIIESISPQICQILNLSIDGMAFLYHKNEDFYDFKIDKLDVVVQGEGFCLENILIEKVSDFIIEEMDAYGFEKRIANIKFIDKNNNCIRKVNEFILNYYNKAVN